MSTNNDPGQGGQKKGLPTDRTQLILTATLEELTSKLSPARQLGYVGDNVLENILSLRTRLARFRSDLNDGEPRALRLALTLGGAFTALLAVIFIFRRK